MAATEHRALAILFPTSVPRLDGKALLPAYEPPPYTGPEPPAEVGNGKLYTGSCHCGAVTLAVKSKPLDETYDETACECNCSICGRVSSHPARMAWSMLKRR